MLAQQTTLTTPSFFRTQDDDVRTEEFPKKKKKQLESKLLQVLRLLSSKFTNSIRVRPVFNASYFLCSH